ncbi:restriction endonuclease subunit S [Aliivibrio fischeri]|uniref:restriction endonuclease subunit S n=1 Tax=Aliivibrio fischeri TaxID=668 RepID=UPI00080E2B63|nr:restriction endonuclease subunit S [Aliivibrio fischeri]OCH40715.1 hypothetical protein A6E02_05175 [Aliivibrio fischeri]
MSWPIEKLGSLVSIKGGGTPSKKVEEYWNGNIPWASVKDLKSRILLRTEDSITQLGVDKSATNVIPKNTIIIPTRMALGKVAIAGVDLAINQDLKALFINNESILDKEFLARFLESKATYIEGEGKGATVKGITLDFLKELQIPLPPLEEQKRIAAILDKTDAIRQKRKQAIELADEFLRSVFLDMFGDPVSNPKGWEVKLISEIAEVQGGLQVSKKRESLPVTCSYLRVANVFRGKLDLSEIKTMQVTQKEMERISLITDDLLVVEGHGNKNEIGRCANWDGSIHPIIHQNHLIRVRVINDLVSPHYLADFINSPGGRVQLARASNTTSGLNTISTKMVKDTIVLIPDLKVQNKYIEIRQEIYALIDNLLIGKEDDMHLFNALSQKAFSGQL